MTPREQRLRERIDTLTQERDKARKSMGTVWRQFRIGQPSNCVYCGEPVRKITCDAHSDLVALDPWFLAKGQAAA